jgi:hypothetical protein
VARAQQTWTQSAGVALILSCAICADGLRARARSAGSRRDLAASTKSNIPVLPLTGNCRRGCRFAARTSTGSPRMGRAVNGLLAVSYRARAAGKSAQYPTLPLGRRSAPFASLPRVARGWLFSAKPYWRSERVDSPARKGGQRQIDANDPTRTSPLSLPTAATTIQSDSGPPKDPMTLHRHTDRAANLGTAVAGARPATSIASLRAPTNL